MTVQIKDLGNDDFVVSVGGVEILAGASDQAIRPGDLLLAAIGACTAGTIRDFAVRNNVSGFDRVDVKVDSEVGTKPTRITDIDLVIELIGNLDTEHVDYLTRVGKHCKIHNTLHREPEITVEARVGETAS
ncbi:OsmC family protein [Specibacter cremeus]|uniref:OsmC family protein n=1 Tax=Specibacter cremeus TaxID=1629051 RepID=UPI000F76A7A6|nr:OsmC family protein [Specibacter cremeus]